MTPEDKICVTIPTFTVKDQIFIRKDALLEELKEMAANTGSDYQKAVIELLLHKINSL